MRPAPVCIESEVPQDALIVSHTDREGIITYVNDTFAAISGYESDQLIGKAHSIVRHPDMPASLFTDLWKTLQEGSMWSGYVKNLRSDGGFYWVHAQVSRLFDKNGGHIGYKSLRSPVERSKRHELEREYMQLKATEENLVKINQWVSQEMYHQISHLLKH